MGRLVARAGTAAGDVGRPQLGPRPFPRSASAWFHGRASESARLADWWQSDHFVVAHGRAGSGKTSLLQAGVLPLVEGKRADVLPPGQLSGGLAYPVAALPEHNPYTLSLLRSWSPGESVGRLAGLSVSEFIRRRAERRDVAILAMIDQGEELLADSGPRRAHARRFLGGLAEALKDWPRLHLLISVRDVALDIISDYLGDGRRYQVRPLSFEGAVEVLTASANSAGRTFAPEGAEALVSDLRTGRIIAADGHEQAVHLDRIEPALLQAVCTRLWDALPAGNTPVTARDVRRYGDADTALAAHCGHIISAVAEDHDLPVTSLRSWLTRTFVTEAGTRGTVPEGVTDTGDLPNAVARSLEDWHLLSSEHRSHARWYELLSDRLVEPLRRATDEPAPPADPAGYLRAAQRALALGDIDLAGHYARKAQEAAPGTDLRLHAEISSLFGNLACERGKPAEAEACYRLAARLFEAVRDAGAVAGQLAAVGQTLIAQGRLAEAVGELQSAVSRVPSDLTVQTRLGWALWQLGETRAGVAVLTGVLAVDGRNPEALRARGEMLADLDDAHDAMRDLDRVMEHDQPSARAARGLALAELGQQQASDLEIERALAEAPRNGPVLFYAARAEALGGDRGVAVELARRAVNATDPALPRHQREIALSLAGQGPDDGR